MGGADRVDPAGVPVGPAGVDVPQAVTRRATAAKRMIVRKRMAARFDTGTTRIGGKL